MKKYLVLLASIATLLPLMAMERAKRSKVDYGQMLYAEFKKKEEADIEKVKNWLRLVEVNQPMKKGITPLVVAVRLGLEEQCRFLIERGANLEATTKNGWTALMWAIVKDHVEISTLLLGKGVNLRAANKYGWTALILAALKGSVKIGKILVANGANLETVDELGRSALMVAALNDRAEVCEALIIHAFIVSSLANEEYNLVVQRFSAGYYSLWKRFKEVTNSMPKDILHEILKMVPDLRFELSQAFMMLLSEGNAHKIPVWYYDIATEAVMQNTVEKLKPLVAAAQQGATSDQMREMLDPETLAKRFGPKLRAHILERIKYKAAMDRAKANYSTALDRLRKADGKKYPLMIK